MPNFRKKSLSLATTLAGFVAFGSLSGCFLDTDNEDSVAPEYLSVSLGGGQQIVGNWYADFDKTIKQFRGIRYGQAPTGNLRFRPPVANTLPATTNATSYGSGCPQLDSGALFGSASTNEDCLFLNVFTPATGENLPVMVWIHGGAYIFGNGGSSYNPSRLVPEGVILVTLNYRLGALGFMAHPMLTAEDNAGNGELPGESGNYGLMDQQLALEWIQDNIASFGGNPDNVTIFGESAGGHSVLSHLAIPSSEGLFHKAIVQSGSYAPDQLPLFVAQLIGSTGVTGITGIGTALGCTGDNYTAACLRSASVSAILAAQPSSVMLPTTGTNLLPSSIASVFSGGDAHPNVPVMMGSNLNEGTLFAALAERAPGSPLTTVEAYNIKVATLLAQYPANNYNSAQIAADYLAMQNGTDPDRFSLAYSAIYTDRTFSCNMDTQSDQLSAETDVYAYHFTESQAFNGLKATATFDMGASHTDEIPYLLRATPVFNFYGGTPNKRALSDQMVDYWTNFAKTGNPNGTGLPAWAEFGVAEGMIDLDDPTATATDRTAYRAAHNCDYWDDAPTNEGDA